MAQWTWMVHPFVKQKISGPKGKRRTENTRSEYRKSSFSPAGSSRFCCSLTQN